MTSEGLAMTTKGNAMYTRREFLSILIPPHPPLVKGGRGDYQSRKGNDIEPKDISEKRETSECPECGRPYFQDDNPDGCPSCRKGMDKRVAEILFGKKGG
ncbi:MAG: hypothetical protein AABY79_13115 [Nitrospirota bacterium]|jgi:hypothetical protein